LIAVLGENQIALGSCSLRLLIGNGIESARMRTDVGIDLEAFFGANRADGRG
jgi:hypothetical protein